MSNSTTRAAYLSCLFSFFFFFNDTATTEIYTLSLHDALPISRDRHHLPIQLLRRPILCPAGTDRQRGGRRSGDQRRLHGGDAVDQALPREGRGSAGRRADAQELWQGAAAAADAALQ